MGFQTFNKTIILGDVRTVPAVHRGANGTTTTINLTTTEQWTDRKSGENHERTEWHRVKLFNKLGETAADCVRKGQQVYIEGSKRTEKYVKDGVDRYSEIIVAHVMKLSNDSQADIDQQTNKSKKSVDEAATPDSQQSTPPAQHSGKLSEDELADIYNWG